MLIDTREPPDDRSPRGFSLDSDAAFLGWIAATIALFACAAAVPPSLGLFLAFVGLCTAWRTLESFVGVGRGGIRDWRQ